MTTTNFLTLLSAFSVISGLVTDAIKRIVNDKANLPYNVVALIVAMFVGAGGTAVYNQLNGILFTPDNMIHMLLMGFASGLVSMVGFDKVKQAIAQLSPDTKA